MPPAISSAPKKSTFFFTCGLGSFRVRVVTVAAAMPIGTLM